MNSKPQTAAPTVPPELLEALAATPAADEAWHDITPLARRDFVTWIESAKQDSTRRRRIAVACDKLARGERRPCCYNVMPLDLHNALKADAAAKAQWAQLTGDEKRDWFDWIEASSDKALRMNRIEQACKALAAGKREP